MARLGARNGTRLRNAGDVVRGITIGRLIPNALLGEGDITGTIGAVAILYLGKPLVGSGDVECSFVFKGTHRRIVITDVDGNLIAEVANAKVGALTKELNRPDAFSFTVPVEDQAADAVLAEEFREVQLWRGDRLLSWGPAVRPAVADAELAVDVKGADWHLLRRTIGKAERENLLTNPSFEQGLTGWNVLRHAGSSEPELAFLLQQPTADANARRSATYAKEGRNSLRIFDGSSDEKKPFVFQDVDVTTGEVPEVFTFTAYARIPSTSFVELNPRSTGLLLGALPWNYRTLNYPGTGAPLPPRGYSNMLWTARNLKFFALGFAKFPNPPTEDAWVRLSCSIEVPAGQHVAIQARFESVRQYVYYDRATLVRSEAHVFTDADQTSEIAHDLVLHAQGLDPAGAPDPDYPNKSDVNIRPSTPPSGVLRDRIYLHSEHLGIMDAIGEFHDLRDGFDYSMLYTPTERRFLTHAPERGVKRRKYGLALGRNIASFAWAFDGESAASSIIVLGEGSGDGREESSAIDVNAFAGGLTLEEVLNAPEDTTVEALDAFAEEELERAKAPEVLAIKTRPHPRGVSGGADGPELIGYLNEGDFVDVNIERGALAIAGEYRVAKLTLTELDALELVLNNRGPR